VVRGAACGRIFRLMAEDDAAAEDEDIGEADEDGGSPPGGGLRYGEWGCV